MKVALRCITFIYSALLEIFFDYVYLCITTDVQRVTVVIMV